MNINVIALVGLPLNRMTFWK